ncbi:hypothetical protein, partial [Pseudomonas fluorescens]|uniref:head-tail joining protein n=1 Tax=Pseudomonas fluorescens TaxID=294 RepID=UPI0012BA3012
MIDWDALVLGPLETIFGEGQRPEGQVTFYPAGRQAYPIDGVFDAAYRDVDLADPLTGVTSTQPVLGVRLALFKALLKEPPAQDDQVYIPSVAKRYLVLDVRPD